MSIRLDYEEPCKHCDQGYVGEYRFSDDRQVCTWCDGTGMQLTAEGEKLAEFIAKYFGIKAPKTMLKYGFGDEEVPNPLYKGD